jgi:hypothetical protein
LVLAIDGVDIGDNYDALFQSVHDGTRVVIIGGFNRTGSNFEGFMKKVFTGVDEISCNSAPIFNCSSSVGLGNGLPKKYKWSGSVPYCYSVQDSSIAVACSNGALTPSVFSKVVVNGQVIVLSSSLSDAETADADSAFATQVLHNMLYGGLPLAKVLLWESFDTPERKWSQLDKTMWNITTVEIVTAFNLGQLNDYDTIILTVDGGDVPYNYEDVITRVKTGARLLLLGGDGYSSSDSPSNFMYFIKELFGGVEGTWSKGGPYNCTDSNGLGKGLPKTYDWNSYIGGSYSWVPDASVQVTCSRSDGTPTIFWKQIGEGFALAFTNPLDDEILHLGNDNAFISSVLTNMIYADLYTEGLE